MGRNGDNSDIAIRRNRLLNFILNNSGDYGAEDLSMLFGVNKKTIQNYISEFNEKGFKIKSSKKRYKVISFPPNLRTFKKNIERSEIWKWMIYQYIKSICRDNKTIKVTKLAKLFMESYHGIVDGQIYAEKLIGELSNDGYIYMDSGNIKLMDNPLKNMTEKQLESVLIYLNIMKNYYPYSVILHQIFFKTKMLYKRKFKMEFNKAAVVLPSKHKISTFDESIVNLIEQAIKEGKNIEFEYKFSERSRIIADVPKGIVYNAWKDTWYVICGNGRDSFYRVDKIINLEIKSDIQNYQDIDFDKDFYNISLGASNEKAVEVEVHFDKKDFIMRKLINYTNMRKEAALSDSQFAYILKDRVCGILEFKRWVRSFGSGAKCISPPELKESMIADINLLKERYGL